MKTQKLQRKLNIEDAEWILLGPGKWGEALVSCLPETIQKKIRRLDMGGSWDDAFRLEDSTKGFFVLIAVPFKAMEETLLHLEKRPVRFLLNASKGIDQQSLQSFSAMAEKIFAKRNKKGAAVQFGSLSGPTFADELAAKKPTAAAIASKFPSFRKQVAQLFSNSYFRLYESEDPLGVEVSAALKNIFAIACGISDGLELGMNARAALLTRGLREMRLLVEAMGGKSATLYGLAGVGDLWMTATGDLSRNRRLGLLLAEGKSVDDAIREINAPVEGHYTVRQAARLGKKLKLDLPIIHQIDLICFEGQNPRVAITELMSRSLKSEDSKTSKLPRRASSKRGLLSRSRR